MTIYLNIGSNQGDRHALIERAVALISEAWPQAGLRRSEYVESAPWGYESSRTFLNLGIAVDIDGEVDPEAVLDIVQHIERRVGRLPHRNADGSYRDRDIDIDIVAIDTMRVDTPRLQLPHPRAARRPFVMEPLRALAPDTVIDMICG